jgi:hypothetical protein
MSKIICDVCGTSYPDSATQCPICGCARPIVDIEEQSNQVNTGKSASYTYVKGGRYSRANVQRRNHGLLVDQNSPVSNSDSKTNNSTAKNDTGLVVAVCALLLAIVAVVIYIVIHFFASTDDTSPKTTDPVNTSAYQITEDTTYPDTSTVSYSCADVVLAQTQVTLSSVGETLSLGVFLTPADTTDQLQFVSENVAVATLSDVGEIVAAGPGETKVIVTCGDISKYCVVICQFDDENSTETESSEVINTELTGPFKINKTDVSISVGETFQLKLTDSNGNIVPVDWSATIADICNIDGNSITGAVKGRTELSVTYNGETFSCIVRVR